MAISEFPVPLPAPSTTLDPERLHALLERLVATQERLVEAVDRLTSPPPATGGRPALRVVR
jgi:hypothetical protein